MQSLGVINYVDSFLFVPITPIHIEPWNWHTRFWISHYTTWQFQIPVFDYGLLTCIYSCMNFILSTKRTPFDRTLPELSGTNTERFIFSVSSKIRINEMYFVSARTLMLAKMLWSKYLPLDEPFYWALMEINSTL